VVEGHKHIWCRHSQYVPCKTTECVYQHHHPGGSSVQCCMMWTCILWSTNCARLVRKRGQGGAVVICCGWGRLCGCWLAAAWMATTTNQRQNGMATTTNQRQSYLQWGIVLNRPPLLTVPVSISISHIIVSLVLLPSPLT